VSKRAPPFGPRVLWRSPADQVRAACESTLGFRLSRDDYARAIFTATARFPNAPYLNLGTIEDIEKIPAWLLERLFTLLERAADGTMDEEPEIGAVRTRGAS